MKSDQLLNLAVNATENKKAEDIISLNMQGISDMT
ncbi:ribosome silencing factor RsfS, partial [Staphylococcus aureus]|nr:ribosome silencing factor RsfS [Staphylococcus aureus]